MKKLIKSILIFILAINVLSGCTSFNPNTTQTIVNYEYKLFDTNDDHEINIDISDNDWHNLLAIPANKT